MSISRSIHAACACILRVGFLLIFSKAICLHYMLILVTLFTPMASVISLMLMTTKPLSPTTHSTWHCTSPTQFVSKPFSTTPPSLFQVFSFSYNSPPQQECPELPSHSRKPEATSGPSFPLAHQETHSASLSYPCQTPDTWGSCTHISIFPVTAWVEVLTTSHLDDSNTLPTDPIISSLNISWFIFHFVFQSASWSSHSSMWSPPKLPCYPQHARPAPWCGTQGSVIWRPTSPPSLSLAWTPTPRPTERLAQWPDHLPLTCSTCFSSLPPTFPSGGSVLCSKSLLKTLPPWTRQAIISESKPGFKACHF